MKIVPNFIVPFFSIVPSILLYLIFKTLILWNITKKRPFHTPLFVGDPLLLATVRMLGFSPTEILLSAYEIMHSRMDQLKFE